MKLNFFVTIRPQKGGYIHTNVPVDITQEEYDILLQSCIDEYEIGDQDESFPIYKKISEIAVEQYDWSTSDYDVNELGYTEYDIEYPDEIIDAAEEVSGGGTNKSRLIPVEEITEDDLIDFDELKSFYIQYLIDSLGYSRNEAEFAATDFDDPYKANFILTEYEATIEFDGTQYEVRRCKTNLMMCGLFDDSVANPFEFYMLFDIGALPDNTVGSYMRAKKKYVVKLALGD